MTARERILDAAARIMREQGIVRATTKEIARAAACSEGLLYKNFAGKHELFVAVLQERLPRPFAGIEPGIGDAVENLERATVGLIEFFAEGFPIAAALFGDRELLSAWRTQSDARGGGPEAPQRMLTAYIRAEQTDGRIRADADADAVSALLVGAALHEAFLASFSNRRIDAPESLARRWVFSALG
ncbi:TetR/AcrR family transcriptional regulator [Microbacterium sp. NPDC056234]|uniref:TetR/AcrR family transcriptional regulator n=1 Tax=Microbacterium sp. NPDC056234 TaxID=3345757 RepID=UPI0035D7F007